MKVGRRPFRTSPSSVNWETSTGDLHAGHPRVCVVITLSHTDEREQPCFDLSRRLAVDVDRGSSDPL